MACQVVLSIEGMMCQNNCASTIRNALKSCDNVEEAVVRFDLDSALIESSTKLDVEELIESVEMMGFDAVQVTDAATYAKLLASLSAFKENSPAKRTTVLRIEGMMCNASCGTTVTNALLSCNDVEEVVVRFEHEAGMIVGNCSVSDLIENVEMMGFDACEITDLVKKASLIKALSAYREEETQHPQEDADEAQTEQLFHQKKYDRTSSVSLLQPDEVALDIVSSSDVNRRRAELSIKGMSCTACVANVEENLPKQIGVLGVSVALIAEKATVEYDANLIDGNKIAGYINSIGYQGTLLEEDLDCDEGVHGIGVLLLKLAHSSPQLLDSLRELDGVLLATIVDEDLTILKIRHINDVIGARDLFNFVQRSGVSCELAGSDAESGQGDDDMSMYYRRMFFGSLVFTIPVVFISMVLPIIPGAMEMFQQPTPCLHITWHALLLWILSTPVQFYFAARFYRNAYNALSHGAANMDVLVVLGTSSAYIYSMLSLIVGMFRHHTEGDEDAHFFETSAMLITFILLGKYLESSARSRTADSITALMDLQVTTALLVEGETTRAIDLRLVQIGDTLKVLPGHRIPVDGVVVKGVSSVDESMLTGEPIEVSKSEGDDITGSTTNGYGVIFMKATRVGSDTALAQIMKLVEDAQSSKAPIQEYADRIAKYFVPVVVLLACLTWFYWFVIIFGPWGTPSYLKGLKTSDEIVFAFKFGMAVLVISCPCALGLATPTAVMVSSGVGASRGILIKGGSAIESGSKITSVLFDKTGTLTKGKPTVTNILNLTSGPDSEFVTMVASAELGSEHVIAKSIVNHAKDVMKVTLREEHSLFEAKPGLGIDCTFEDGTRVIVGNRKLMKLNKIKLCDDVVNFMADNEANGTVILAAAQKPNGSFETMGGIAVTDPVHENAPYVISMLRSMGIKTYMCTGDNEVTAHAVAKQIGIPEERVFANCLPKQKTNKVKKLQLSEKVAFVGDGVNDAAALTLADLGIAVGAGTDIAMKSADVVLIRNNLLDVAVMLHLARKTIQRIKINFFFSFAYNMLCIPIAAGFLYPTMGVRLPPALAGFMMAMSSVSVVVSSLLLKLYKPPAMMELFDDDIMSSEKICDDNVELSSSNWKFNQSGYSKIKRRNSSHGILSFSSSDEISIV